MFKAIRLSYVAFSGIGGMVYFESLFGTVGAYIHGSVFGGGGALDTNKQTNAASVSSFCHEDRRDFGTSKSTFQ